MTPAPPPHEPPVLNIIGGRVSLGPLRRDLGMLYLQWRNDFELQGLRGGPLRPTTLEAGEALVVGALCGALSHEGDEAHGDQENDAAEKLPGDHATRLAPVHVSGPSVWQ